MQLSSKDNPRIKQLIALRTSKERRSTGRFIAEGVREIRRAFAAGLPVDEVFFCPQKLTTPLSELEDVLDQSAGVFEVTPELLSRIAYRQNPEGILAVVQQPKSVSLEDPVGDESLWLIASGVAKPGNLGAMARTVAAAGGAGIFVVDGVVDAYNPNAIRASTGALFTLPTLHGDFNDLDNWVRRHRVRLFAATVDAPDHHHAVNLTARIDGEDGPAVQPVGIAIGPEDQGLDARFVELAAATGGVVTIPMPGAGDGVDSLNASNAAAVLLFEAVRQRS